ncbi:fluoride efflux transporter FluC [Rothia sp. CCM 9418]|uniref:fluoride efflux transporter FluC n=1 Tax=Rothia sp. CCM 9418 TaxID=3402661 RepID=UPI003AEB8B1F
MNYALIIGIFIAGGTGAWARFTCDQFVKKLWKKHIPLGTFIINIIGSFFLGLLAGTIASQTITDTWIITIIGAGFLGGFTTFSSAMVEVVTHLQIKQHHAVYFLLLIQPLLALTCAALGFTITS